MKVVILQYGTCVESCALFERFTWTFNWHGERQMCVEKCDEEEGEDVKVCEHVERFIAE